MESLTSSYETYVRKRFILRSDHNTTLTPNFCQHPSPQIRERTFDPHFLDFTDLLGYQLMAHGFRLYHDRFGQHLVFGGKNLKQHPVDAYSLKVIKRYCRLYLQKIRTA